MQASSLRYAGSTVKHRRGSVSSHFGFAPYYRRSAIGRQILEAPSDFEPPLALRDPRAPHAPENMLAGRKRA